MLILQEKLSNLTLKFRLVCTDGLRCIIRPSSPDLNSSGEIRAAVAHVAAHGAEGISLYNWGFLSCAGTIYSMFVRRYEISRAEILTVMPRIQYLVIRGPISSRRPGQAHEGVVPDSCDHVAGLDCPAMLTAPEPGPAPVSS